MAPINNMFEANHKANRVNLNREHSLKRLLGCGFCVGHRGQITKREAGQVGC